MKVSLHNLPDSGVKLKSEEPSELFPDLAEIEKKEGLSFISPIRTAVTIEPAGDIYRLVGKINYTVNLTCSKCLDQFEHMINETFAVALSNLDKDFQSNDQSEIELSAQEMGMVLFQGDEVELKEVIQEQILLALPMHPKCDEKCKGLCPNCGANLNHSQCQCKKDNVDERFAALKTLKLIK